MGITRQKLGENVQNLYNDGHSVPRDPLKGPCKAWFTESFKWHPRLTLRSFRTYLRRQPWVGERSNPPGWMHFMRRGKSSATTSNRQRRTYGTQMNQVTTRCVWLRWRSLSLVPVAFAVDIKITMCATAIADCIAVVVLLCCHVSCCLIYY